MSDVRCRLRDGLCKIDYIINLTSHIRHLKSYISHLKLSGVVYSLSAPLEFQSPIARPAMI